MLHSGIKNPETMVLEKAGWAKSLPVSINEKEFSLFSDYVARQSGIIIPVEKSYIFETRLSKYLVSAGVNSFEELYDFIINKNDPLLNQSIINSVTTNETKWFRDETPWKVLEENMLPGFVGDLLSGKKTRIRIWSAAASTGQEIYSTVMCVDNYLKRNNIKDVTLKQFEFFATDISSRVLEIAKKGRYDRISIKRGLSEQYKAKYFTGDGLAWNINPEIRSSVQFAHFNLMNSYEEFGMFDIIFCRYVLIYFSDALKSEIAGKMYDSLNDKGVLFTGNYALYDLFRDNFKSDHYGNLTYYIKKKRGEK